MFDQVKEALNQYCRLDRHRDIVVGVSGGPDSLCLLHILHRLGYRVIVCHIDHGLRAEAGDEAAFVQTFSENLSIPFFVERSDVRVIAQENRQSIEEAAREVRYQYLFRQAKDHDAQAVAVGHNADDQVETVLMHLLRGSGLSGLRGMQYVTQPTTWSDRIPLVRPLLGVWRAEIADYCESEHLNPVFDLSNLDQTIHRNRIRHELIPRLETYNPRIKQILLRTAQILAGDDQLIKRIVDRAWERSLVDQAEGVVSLDRAQLLELELGLQRRLLRHAIKILRPELKDINFSAIERALLCVRSEDENTGCDLIAGLGLTVEGSRLWVAETDANLPVSEWPQINPDRQYQLDIPGKLELIGGWQLTAEIDHSHDPTHVELKKNTDPNLAWFDADQIDLPLIMRVRTPGERFNPLGMEGHSIKVSEFMINEKVPQRARGNWPLVISGKDVIWIPGVRQSHLGRVTASTERLLRLALIPEMNGDLPSAT